MDPMENCSDANVRYVCKLALCTESEARTAILSWKGDIMAAVSFLRPELKVPRFPELYYCGAFRRVDDPDRDLPQRVDGLILDAHSTEREIDRNDRGERYIAPFYDANTIDDICAVMLPSYNIYPGEWSEDERFFNPTIQGALAHASDRIRNKIKRTKGSKRERFLSILDSIESAKTAFWERDYENGYRLYRKAAEDLRSRTYKLKTRFIVGPDGTTEDIQGSR